MTRWPLAVLLDLAAREQASALLELSAALAAERSRAEERAAVDHELRDHHRAWGRASEGPALEEVMEAAGLQARRRHLERLADESARLADSLCMADAALSAARRETERRRDALAAARRAVRALESHRDAWLASFARQRARRDELADDDLVSARPRAAR